VLPFAKEGFSMGSASDCSQEILTVYPSKTMPSGWWCPRYGDIAIPEGWELLPPGDAYITRQVKRMGPYWVAKKPRRGYKETLGVWAPQQNIEAARRLAKKTEERRVEARRLSRRRQERGEEKYGEQFKQKVYEFLDFAPEYESLAKEIAEAAADHATQVGSGRVGRTKKLLIEQRAELAARAYIRHKYTDYESNITDKEIEFIGELPDDEYREIKAEAEWMVDEYLEKHRKRLNR